MDSVSKGTFREYRVVRFTAEWAAKEGFVTLWKTEDAKEAILIVACSKGRSCVW